MGARENLAGAPEVQQGRAQFSDWRHDVLDRCSHGQTQGIRDAMATPAAKPHVSRATAGGFVSLGSKLMGKRDEPVAVMSN